MEEARECRYLPHLGLMGLARRSPAISLASPESEQQMPPTAAPEGLPPAPLPTVTGEAPSGPTDAVPQAGKESPERPTGLVDPSLTTPLRRPQARYISLGPAREDPEPIARAIPTTRRREAADECWDEDLSGSAPELQGTVGLEEVPSGPTRRAKKAKPYNPRRHLQKDDLVSSIEPFAQRSPSPPPLQSEEQGPRRRRHGGRWPSGRTGSTQGRGEPPTPAPGNR